MGKAGSVIGGAGTGAGIGAAVGSAIPGVGTGIGAGVGAVTGGIAGLLSANSDEKAARIEARRLALLEAAKTEYSPWTRAALGNTKDLAMAPGPNQLTEGLSGIATGASLYQNAMKAMRDGRTTGAEDQSDVLPSMRSMPGMPNFSEKPRPVQGNAYDRLGTSS